MLRSTKVEDRDMKVFNATHQSGSTSLKQYLMDLEMQEAERLININMTEDKLDQAIESTQALRFLAENEKNMKFRNKRQ